MRFRLILLAVTFMLVAVSCAAQHVLGNPIVCTNPLTCTNSSQIQCPNASYPCYWAAVVVDGGPVVNNYPTTQDAFGSRISDLSIDLNGLHDVIGYLSVTGSKSWENFRT